MAENRSSGAKDNARNKAARSQGAQGPATHSLRLTLEPRMVFDASVAVTAVDIADHTHDVLADVAARTAESHDAAKAPAEPARAGDGGAEHGTTANPDQSDQVQSHPMSAVAAGGGASPTPPDSASVLQLVFVDPRMEGAAEAVATLGAGTKVVTLDSGRDGIRQISDALSGTSGLQAIHILAPGADGSVTVGRDSLTTAALTGRADEVASWRDHLADGAGITLHGADMDGSAKGQLLARTLADLTGADVSSTDDLHVQDAHAADTAPTAERRIVVIDARVEDAETLLGDLPADVERLVVGADDDGIALIQGALQGGNVSSLQIVAHGSPGSLTLGRDVLNADALAGTAGEAIAGWKPSFTEDADILLLGCDVGQGSGGALFLSRLADLTGADIAASDDPTGSTDLGGDWVLEKTVGTVESGIAISGRAQADWHGLLADPVVNNSGGPTRTVVEDTSTPITGISVSDADAADTLTVTLNVSNGTLSLTVGSAAVAYANGSKTATVSGSAAAVNAALATLIYTPAANSNAADLLRVQVGDGTTTTTLTPDIAIAITPVNDAPTLTRGAQLTTMTEGDSNPAGTLVTAILASSGYADADSGALQGIAIVGTNTTQGTWWYSTNGGANWLSMGARSDQNALLLAGDAGTMIRFIPATDFNGTAWIQYRAWDRTSGTAGSTIDLSDPATLGGDTAFSAERQLGTVAVAAVNDAPTLSPTAASVDEGRGKQVVLGYAVFGLHDVDMNVLLNSNPQMPQQIMFKLAALPDPAKGFLLFGDDRLVVGSTFSLMDVLTEKIKYQHTGYQTTAPGGTRDSFSVTVDDGAGGTVGATAITININPVNQAPVPTVTLDGVAYEGRKGVGLTIGADDPDQTSASWTVTFGNVRPGDGTLYIDANNNGVFDAGEQVTDGASYTGTLAGLRLRYDVSANEPSATAPSFTVTLRDDGGGTGTRATGSTTYSIPIRENNDDPVLTTFGNGTARTVSQTVDSANARVIAIDTAILNVKDPDSLPANISFNLSHAPDGSVGVLQVRRGGAWYNLAAGGNFTLAEVMAGSVRYYVRTNGTGTFTDSVTFQIRDSAVTEFSTVRQTVSPRDGGARNADDTDYLTFTLNFRATIVGSPGGGGTNPVDFIVNTPSNAVTTNVTPVQVSEGGAILFARNTAGQPQLLALDSDTPDDQLVYRLSEVPTGGWIQVYTGSGDSATDTDPAHWRTVNRSGSFTQADVNAGKVRFLHDGSEDLIQSFSFTVSDGANVTAVQTVAIDVLPVNDTPTAGTNGTALLGERDTANPEQKADNGYYVFNKGSNVSITLGDVDGSGDKTGAPAYQSSDTQLGFTVVTGPVGGMLQVYRNGSWQAVVIGSTFITKAELEAGNFRYVHNGDEVFSDSFAIRVDDGQGQPNSLSTPQTIALSIARFNDPPAPSANTGLLVGEGATAVIGGVDSSGNPLGGAGTALSGTGKATLSYTDPDNDTEQRQYLITDSVDNGYLKRNGVVMGVGSVFTQKDLDDGLITYEHNGGEVFTDGFSFRVSDGGGVNVPGSFTIKVLPRNEAPTLGTLPTYRIYDTSGPISFTGDSLISVADGDLLSVDTVAGETDVIQVTLDARLNGVTYANGALTIGSAELQAIELVEGSNGLDGRLVIRGTLAGVNAALASLTYRVTQDVNDIIDLVITADDRLNGGTNGGGANGGVTNENGDPIDAAHNTVTKTVRLYASNSNDAAVVEGPGTPLAVNEDATLAFKNANGKNFAVQITDPDAFGIAEAAGSVTVTVLHGTLAIGSTSGVSTALSDGGRTLTLTGTRDAINAALLSMTYSGNADYNGTDSLTVTVAAKSGNYGLGGATAVSQSFVITINPVNDTPTVTNGGAAVQAVSTTTPYVFDAAHGNRISVGDAKDSGASRFNDVVTVTVSLDGNDPAGILTLSTAAGLTGTTTGAGSITFTGTLAAVNAALNGMTYTPSSYDLDKTVRLTVTIDDGANGGTALTGGVGGAQTASVSVDLNVSNTNDPPAVTVPADPLTVAEDSSLTMTGAGKVFVLTDVDDFGAGGMSVTLVVDNGTLSIAQADGTTITGTGTSGSPLVITGTKAQINAALDGLKFTPTANFHGTATITANAGDGISPATTVTKTITVTSVNDRPTATGSVTLTPVDEDTANPPGTVIGTLVGGTYSDQTDNQSTKTNGGNSATDLYYVAIVGATNYDAAQGRWQVSNGSGGWIDILPTANAKGLNGVTIKTYSDTSALVVRSDQTIRFVPAANFYGTPGSLQLRLADGSKTDIAVSSSGSDGKDLTSAAGGSVNSATGSWSSGKVAVGTSVTNVNDRPTAANGTLPGIDEGNLDPSGSTVQSLFGTAFADNTDKQAGITGGSNSGAAGSLGGIAIVGNATTTEGTWQYQLSGSTTWVDIGEGGSAPSDSAAIVLATTAKLRFVPANGDWFGTPPALTVRVADTVQTSATGVNLFAVVPDGATSTWSTTYTLGTTVKPANDAPTLTGTSANPTVVEQPGEGTGSSWANLLDGAQAAGAADPDVIGAGPANFGGGRIIVTLTGVRTGDLLRLDGSFTGVSGTPAYDAATGTLTIALTNQATTANIGAILKAIQYGSSSDNPSNNGLNATRGFSIVLNDGNNDGLNTAAGQTAALTSNALTGTITITPANDAPKVDLDGDDFAPVTHGATFTEGGNAGNPRVAIADADATLVDKDNTNLARLSVAVGGLRDGNNEILSIGGTDFLLATSRNTTVTAGGVTYRVDYVAGAGTGTFTITRDGGGVLALTDVQALLRGMQYTQADGFDTPTAGDRSFTVSVTDAGPDNAGTTGGLTSAPAVSTITVVPTNDQPRITGLTGNTWLENTLNAGPQVIDADVTLRDDDSATFGSTATLTVGGLVAGQDVVSVLTDTPAGLDAVRLNTATGKVEYHDGTGWLVIGTAGGGNGAPFTVTFNGTTPATRAMVERVIESLTFRNTSDDPVTSRTLTVTLTDGISGGAAETLSIAIGITPENEAPRVTASDVTVDEGTGSGTLVLGGNVNWGLTVADPDDQGGVMQVTVTVSAGIISAVGGPATVVSGLESSTITLTGKKAQLNASLNALSVRLPSVGGQAASDWNGRLDVTVVVNDLGNTGQRPATLEGDGNDPRTGNGDYAYGSGTALETTRVVHITVTPRNDTPGIGGPASVSLNEDATITFDGTAAGAITISDAADLAFPSATDLFQVTLGVGHGTLTLGTITGLIFGQAGDTDEGQADAWTNQTSITLRGSKADIEAALRTLTYAPTANHAGTDALSIGVNDLNNGGAGGRATTATKTVAITINAVTDAVDLIVDVDNDTAADGRQTNPTGPLSLTATEDVWFNLPIAAATVDADGSEVLTIRVSGLPEGTIARLGGTGAGDGTVVTVTNGALTLTGVTRNALQSLWFKTPQDWNTQGGAGGGATTLTVEVKAQDSANGVTPAATTRTVAINLTVRSVEDLPVPQPDTAAVHEDGNADSNPATVQVVTGNVRDNDHDADEDETFDVISVRFNGIDHAVDATTGATVTTPYGTLTIKRDGSYTYTLNNAAAQALRTGQAPQEVFTYAVRDRGGLATDSDTDPTSTLTITIHGLNDAPVVDLDGDAGNGATGTSVTFTESPGAHGAANAVALFGAAVVSDADSAKLSGIRIDWNGVTDGNQEVLSIGGTAFALGTNATNTAILGGTFTVTVDVANKTVTIRPAGGATRTVAEVQALLRGITYADTGDAPDTSANRTFTLTVTDAGNDDTQGVGGTGVLGSAAVTSTVTVVATNDAVAVGVSGLTGNGYTLNEDSTLTLDGLSGRPKITVADPDGADVPLRATVAITAGPGMLTIGNLHGATAVGGVTSGTSVTLTGTESQINAALATLSYFAGANVNGSATVQLTVSDLGNSGGRAPSGTVGGDTNDATSDPGDYAYADGTSAAIVTTRAFTLTVAPLNDQPTFDSAPATASVNEEGTVAFDGATGNPARFQVADAADVAYPSGVDAFTVTVSVPTGLSTIANVDGTGRHNGTGATVTGNGTGSLTIAGTLAQVNAALADLRYTAPLDYSGTVTMTVTVDDHNYGGPSGEATTRTTTTAITVNPVSDQPGLTAGNVTGDEDTDIPLSIAVTNTDTVGPAETLTCTLGGIPAGWVLKDNGVALTLIDNGDGTFRTAELPQSKLATLTIRPPQDWNSSDPGNSAPTLTVTAYSSDQGAAKASRTGTFTVTVTKVSDDTVPQNDANSIDEDTASVSKTAATGVLANDTDVDRDQTLVVKGVAAGSGGSAITNGTGVGTGVTGSHGTLTLNADGSYNYVLDTAAAQALRAGQVWTDVFTYTVNDSTNLGTPKTATLTITITGSNDAPVVDLNGALTGTDTSLTYTEVDGFDLSVGQALWSNATVTDPDSARLTGLTIAATNILDGNGEILRIGGTDFALATGKTATVTAGGTSFTVTLVANGTGATITIAPQGTPAGGVGAMARADTQALLAGITYRNVSDNPNVSANRGFAVQAGDAGSNDDGTPAGTSLGSNTARATVTVVPTNEAPDVDLNGGTAGRDVTLTYAEVSNGAEPELAIAPAAALSDVDNRNLTRLVLTVGGLTHADAEYLTIGGVAFALGTDVTGRVVDAGALGRFSVSIATVSGNRQVDIRPVDAGGTATASALGNLEGLLRGITYRNSSDDPTGTRSISVQVTDAGTNDAVATDDERASNLPTVTIGFTPANDKPRLGGLDAVTFRENVVNAAPQVLDSAVTLVDLDSADFNGGSLTVMGLLTEDRLGLTGNFRLDGTAVQFNDGTAWTTIGTATGGAGSDFTVTFTSTAATPAVVRSLIQSLTYANVSDTPTRDRTLTITVDDGDSGGAVAAATIAVTVLPDNDAPVVDLNGTAAGTDHTVTFTDGANAPGTPVAIAADAALSDLDDTALRAMRVEVGGVQNGDAEVLRLPTTGGTGFVDVALGTAGSVTVTVSGSRFTVTTTVNGAQTTLSITPADGGTEHAMAAWRTLLQGIRYANASDTPLGTSRTVEVQVTDDGSADLLPAETSNRPVTTITIVPANDQPRFSGNYQAVTFAENAVNVVGGAPAALIADPAAVTLADPDSTDLQGGSITVSGLASDDVLSLPVNPAAAGGAVRLSGTTVQVYDGGAWRAIGTLSGGQGGTLTISLNGADAAAYATVANVERVVEALTYQNSSDRPTPGPRTLTITVDDGDGGVAGTATVSLSVTPENDRPTISGFGSGSTPTTYTEHGAAVLLGANATLGDADIGGSTGGVDDYRGVVLTFQRNGGTPNADDRFGFNGSAATAGSIYASGTELRLANGTADPADDTVIGTIGTTTAGRLQITIAGNAAVTQALASRIVQSVTYAMDEGAVNAGRAGTLSIDLIMDDRRGTTTVDQGTGGVLTATATTVVTVVPVNDPPVNTVPGTLTGIKEDTPFTFSGANGFSVSDVDVNGNPVAADRLMTVTMTALHGVLTLGDGTTRAAVTFTAGDGVGDATVTVTGTLAQLQALLATVTYQGNANFNGTDSITITTNDRGNYGTGGPLQDADTVTFTVEAVNDAPTATSTAAVVLAPVAEDVAGTDNGGALVGDLFAVRLSDSPDAVTGGSSANGFHGIAIVSGTTDPAKGAWQYQIGGTGPWIDVGDRTLATALVLGAGDRLRFQPAADFNGAAPDLGVRLIENGGTPPAGGSVVDLSSAGATGGATRYADAGSQIALKTSVTAVNDRPVVVGSGPVAIAVTEDTTPAGATFASLLAGRYTDATDDQTAKGGSAGATPLSFVAVVGNAAVAGQGSWQYLANGTTWTDIPSAGLSAASALVLDASTQLRFVPAANFHGTPGALTLRLADGSANPVTVSGSATDLKDLSAVGGTGPTGRWSLDTVALQPTVANVNDAPTATGTATLAPVAEDTPAGSIPGATVASLFGPLYGDAADDRTGVPGGADAHTPTLAGVAIVGNAATAGQGQWWYSTDGTTWTLLPTDLSDTNALVLPTTTSLRFVPAADWNGTPGGLTVRLSDATVNAAATGQTLAIGGTNPWSATTVTLTTSVTAVEDAIEAQDDTNGIVEDAAAPATGNVLDNDRDRDALGTVDPQTLYVTAIRGTGPAATPIDTSANAEVSIAGRYGTLTIRRDGSYSYTLDSSLDVIQQLRQGQVLTDEVFTYTVDDVLAADGSNVGSAAVDRTLTITITGVNDAPVAKPDTGAIQEDASAPATGSVLANDVEIDGGDPGTVTAVGFGATAGTVGTGLRGGYGTLTLKADGTWAYVVDNGVPAVQALAAGETLSETFTYTVTDTAGATSSSTLTITITGTNDAPVLATDGTRGAVTEDASSPTLTGSGAIAFTDLDLSNTHTVAVGPATVTTSAGIPAGFVPAGGFGTLTAAVVEDATDVSDAGQVTWRFTVDNAAVQGLAAGETVTQLYRLTLTDSSGATVTRDVTVTITGTNDAPTVGTAKLTGTVTEDAGSGTLTDSGTIAFADVDLSDAHSVSASFVSTSGTAPLGTLTAVRSADTTGSGTGGSVTWTYAVDNAALQFLREGETVTETYAVTVSDGKGGTVTRTVVVTIVGTNDAPTVTGAPPTASGTAGQEMVLTVDPARFADVDRGDRLTFTATLADGSPLPGWLVFDPATLTFRGTPPQEAAGTLSLVLRATDTAGASASLGVTFTIVAEVQRGDTPTPTTPPGATPTTPTTGDPGTPGTGTLITGPGFGTPSTPGGLTTGFPGGTLTPISSGLGGDGLGSGAANAAGQLRLGNGDLSTSALFQQYSQANVELFLAGSVGNQTLLPMQQASFQVPKNIFRHTNPNERLIYQAVRPDGSPLPNWLQFDAQNLAFRGAPPATARGALDIVIVAKDSRGNQAAAQFRVLVTQDLNTQTPIGNGRGQQPARTEGQPGGQGQGQGQGEGESTGRGEGQAPDQEQDQRPILAPGRDVNPPEAKDLPTLQAPKEQRADAGAPDSMEGADAWMTAGIPAGRTADAGPAAGRSSFTAQLHAAGRPGLLAEARALLNTLLQSDDRNAA